MSMTTLVRHRKSLAAVPAAGLVMMLLAGCGGGTTAAAANVPVTGTTNNTGNGDTANGNGGARTFPGASGQIAAIEGKTLQVQNTTTQTAVKYTDSTKLSQTVAATQSDLAVGKCISARSTDTGAATGATPGTPPDTTTPVAAASVTISDPVNGTCVGGIGGFGGAGAFGGGRGNGGGFRGQGSNGAAPGTAPTGQPPSGAPNGFRGGMGRGVDGKITKIDGDTVTVQMQQRQFNPNNAAGSTTAAPTTTTVTRTVTVSSATTYTKNVSASASDLKVGKCVTAFGTADTSGAITATSIALRPADNGSCTSAMFGGGRRNGGANATGGTATTAS
jgi:hypothetical protein